MPKDSLVIKAFHDNPIIGGLILKAVHEHLRQTSYYKLIVYVFKTAALIWTISWQNQQNDSAPSKD